MEGFVRLNKTLNDKGMLISTNNLDKVMADVVSKEATTDWYRSLFTFGQEAKEHFDSNGSIAGYNGSAYTNNLVFDLDNEDLNKAKQDVDTLLKRLSKEVGLGKDGIAKHVRVYFSGNKGFHLFVKTSKQYSSEELKEYCSVIAEGIASFDSVIYNKTRCFRVANTLNPKSGLYKIPVTLDLIRDKDGIEKIRQLAIAPNLIEDSTVPLEDTASIDNYVEFKRQYVKKKRSVIVADTAEVNGIRGVGNIDFKKGRNIPKCIYALSQGIMIPGKGHRHEVFLHLGNYYRNQGHAVEVVEAILGGIADLNAKLYPEKEPFSRDEIKSSVIKMVFADDNKLNPGGWGVAADNKVFTNYCASLPLDCKCPIHDKHARKHVVKIDDVSDDFSGFAANFEENITPTGIKFLDETVKITKGTTTLIVGAAGTGKTTLCLAALENTNKAGTNSMFFSLDMHRSLVYLKLAQRFTKHSQEEIFKIFKQREVKKIQEIKEIIKNNYNRTYFDFSSSLSIEDIIQRVDATEQQSGEKINLVVVDYASRLTGPHSDANANEKFNALKSKEAADVTDSAWMILNQVSRSSGSGFTPLRTKRVALGSGEWENSASNVITVWRSFMGLDGVQDAANGVTFNDSYINVAIVKNRMGPEKEEVLHWNGKAGTIRDMTVEEREQYHYEEKPKIKLALNYRQNDG
jgi:RecA/RadA recombinase